MHIDEPRPVETCCVFFAPGFVEQVAQDATKPINLDTPPDPALTLPYPSALHTDRDQASTAAIRLFGTMMTSSGNG